LDTAEVRLPETALLNVNAPPYASRPVRVVRLPERHEERDLVAVEEPLELRIDNEPVAVTMRTPGHDEELALGFAVGEGLDPLEASTPSARACNPIELPAPAGDPSPP